MNPYAPCCSWNKTIKGEQLTIAIYVDNLKLSQEDRKVVIPFIAKSESIYATIYSMTVHQGKVHHYLGMTMNFRVQGEVQIIMYDYIKKLIDSLPEDMIGVKHTAAPEYLFWTDEESSTLSKDMKELFHKITAQVL